MTQGKSPLLEKLFRFGIPAALIWGGINLWNYIAPTIIKSLENLWLFALWAIPTTAVVGWVAMNPKTIYMMYLGMCRKLTGWFIKMDPLSVMDGYLALLRKKHANLEQTRLLLEGKKVKLERMIQEKKKAFDENNRLAVAAQKQNELMAAKMYASKALVDKQSIDSYSPILAKYVRNNSFLNALAEDWGSSIESLAYTIENKREEFNNLKEMFKGLKSADDFINSDNEAAQTYAMSVKALEEDVSQRIAYIEDFEKKAKPIMTGMKVQKQANEDAAMQMLEELVRQDSIKLPDYTNVTTGMIKVAETIPYQDIKNKYNL